MRLPWFVAFILILASGWMHFYAQVHEHFNGVSEYKNQLALLKNQVEGERTSFAVQREQFLEFRQAVASLMPEVLKEKGEGLEGYPYRSLASTISKKESETVRATIAKTLFEKGKVYFKDKNYEKANLAFRKIIRDFGFTLYVPESYFLLAESHFQENELEECIETIQEMVELFPQHELTGFALVRLGRIYQMQNRSEEAVDIYKTVIRSFPQRDVVAQAKSSLRELDQ